MLHITALKADLHKQHINPGNIKFNVGRILTKWGGICLRYVGLITVGYNSLWPSGAIWHYESWSTSHNLNRCWLFCQLNLNSVTLFKIQNWSFKKMLLQNGNHCFNVIDTPCGSNHVKNESHFQPGSCSRPVLGLFLRNYLANAFVLSRRLRTSGNIDV